MDMPRNELARRSLILLLVTVLLSYPAAIAVLGSEKAIETGNVILLSLASGIVVAYAPVAFNAFRFGMIDGANILSIGIFASWLGVAGSRSVSIVWRLLDQPVDWLNSGWWGFHLAMSAAGAMCHLIAPEAVAGHVPTRQWIRIGLMVAASVFVVAALALLNVS